jgi:hypothetical protein
LLELTEDRPTGDVHQKGLEPTRVRSKSGSTKAPSRIQTT